MFVNYGCIVAVVGKLLSGGGALLLLWLPSGGEAGPLAALFLLLPAAPACLIVSLVGGLIGMRLVFLVRRR